MPEPLEADLVLSYDDALARIEEIRTTLEDALTTAAQAGSDSLAQAMSTSSDTARADLEAALTGASDVGGAALSDAFANQGEQLRLTIDEGITSGGETGAANLTAAIDAATAELRTSLDDALTSAAESGAGALTDSISASVDSATSSVSSLGEASKTASENGKGFEGTLKGMEGAALLAGGQVGGMRSVVQGFGAAAVPAVAGSLALVEGFKEVVSKGIEGTSATQRFNLVLGDMADTVRRVQVGDLDTSIEKLSITMGSVPSRTEQAASSLFTLYTNAGLTRGAAAQATDQIIALAARSVAAKPALGDIGTVAEQMGIRLARGGPFAARLGVSLTSSEIAAKAATLGFTGVNGVLSVGEKSAAAAAAAVDKYGSTLSEAVAKGSDNAVIKQRRFTAELDTFLEKLGAPLVTPIFDLFQAGLPAVEALGEVLAKLGSSALPGVTAATKVAVPVLQALSDVIDFLGPALPPLIDAWIAYKTVQLAVGAATWIANAAQGAALLTSLALRTETELDTVALAAEGEQMTLFGTEASGATEQLALFNVEQVTAGVEAETAGAGGLARMGSALGAIGGNLPGIAAGAGLLAIGFSQAGESGTQGAIGIGSMAAGGALIGSTFGPAGTVIGGFAGLVGGLAKQFLGGGESAEEYAKRIKGLADAFDGLAQKKIDKQVGDQISALTDTFSHSDAIQVYKRELIDLGEQSPAAAQKVVTALQNLRNDAGKPVFSNSEITTFTENVAKGEGNLRSYNTEKKKSADTNSVFAASETGAAGATNDAAAAAKAAKDAMTGYKDSLDALIGVHLSQQEAASKFNQALTDTRAQLAFTGGTIDLNTEAGRKNSDALTGAAGAAISYAQAIFATTGSTEAAKVPLDNFANSLLSVFPAGTAAHDGIVALLTQLGIMPSQTAIAVGSANTLGQTLQTVGGNIAAAAVQGFGTFPTEAQLAMLSAQGAVAAGGPPIAAAASGAGVGAAQNFTAGASGMAGGAGQAVGAASEALSLASARGLLGTAYDLGIGTGSALAQGIAAGISANTGIIRAAARGAVDEAKSAADQRAHNSSPSKLFAEVGRNMALGVAVGITDAIPEVVHAARGMVDASVPDTGGATRGRGVGGGMNQTNIFNHYDANEAAAATGREWNRQTRRSG